MPATLRYPTAAESPSRRLLICTAVVMAAHALLIVGLPRWGQAGQPGLGKATFITRMIAPPAPVPAAPAPAPIPAPAPVPAPSEEKPVEPNPAPKPKPPPKPIPAEVAKPQVSQPPTPAPRQETTSETPPTPPAGGAIGQAGTGSDKELSILAMPPPPQFGPFPGVTPIAQRPTDAEADAVRPSIKSAGDAPALPPHPARITFEATGTVAGIPVTVPTTLVWRHDGSFYEANWVFYHVKAGEQSHYASGLITPQGLAPLEASFRTPKRQEMRFDHAGERLEFAPEPAEWKMPAGTQDRLSMIVQLASLLAADPDRYPGGSAITLPLASANPPSVQNWSFLIDEEEQHVEGMDGKTLRAVHLTHIPRQDGDTRLELWLAPALEYLPARVSVVEPNGDTIDFKVKQAYGLEVRRVPPSTE